MFTSTGFHTVHGSGIYEEIHLTKVNNDNKLITDSTAVNYVVTNYKKSFNLLIFTAGGHILLIRNIPIHYQEENILNTFLSEIYFTYNRNERFKETGALFAYGGLYPIIRVGASYTLLDRSFTDTSRTINWNEFSANIGASVPLTFTKGSYSQSVTGSATFNNRNVYYIGPQNHQTKTSNLIFADVSVSFTNQQIKALQNIYPKFGPNLCYYRHRFDC